MLYFNINLPDFKASTKDDQVCIGKLLMDLFSMKRATKRAEEISNVSPDFTCFCQKMKCNKN